METEHGPLGDEINLIEVDTNKGEIQNYGWAIASDGDHYAGAFDSVPGGRQKIPFV